MEQGNFENWTNVADPVRRGDGKSVHAVRFYEDERVLWHSVADFVTAGLAAGEAAIVIAGASHCASLRGAVAAVGRKVVEGDALPTGGELLLVDAATALEGIMRGSEPDEALFRAAVGGMIDGTLAAGVPGLRVYGEMVDVLWAAGNGAAAARLEALWHELQSTRPFTLLCAYGMGHFREARHAPAVRAISEAHDETYPAESWDRLDGEDARRREIVELQQRARALETELAERRELELVLREALEERRRSETEAQASKAAAERATRVKTDFLAVMSHELRTPLNAIVGYEGLMSMEIGGAVTEQQRGFLQRIRGAADQLLRLIDQILSLSRDEAGRDDLQVETVDARLAAEEAVALVEPAAAAKGLRLRLVVPGEPLVCETDVGKLRQILLNLLANAVKFTASGGVDLTLSRADGSIRFEVRDTGAGIEPGDLERIFEPFVQADATSTRLNGGVGLGLSVSRDLARMLGGSLTAYSEPGTGSVFRLGIPLRAAVAAGDADDPN